jgi:omega-6 fatty acid desaturase (delta-12 desaturase)
MLDLNGNVFEFPEYTINELRKAIPTECFERSALTGFYYIARDLATVASVFWVFQHFVTPEYVPSVWVRGVLWSLYGFINGLFGTGLWILGHECGHQAFSQWKVLNDTVGFILHSALLVPYFSWKISHGKHHKATGHMERDMVHVPRTREQYSIRSKIPIDKLSEVTEETPLASLLLLFARQLFGWPFYLLANNTGHNFHERQAEGKGVGKRNGWFRGVNHFNPSSPLFESKDAKWIWISDIGVFLALAGLYQLGRSFGFSNIAVWYLLPYLWVNHWLVAITYLQHTDPTLAHYDAKSWSFVRGAASTIDRDMGFIGRNIFHGIADTHVLHHYVSTIPFYNADKATEAIKPVMGAHYRSDPKYGPWEFTKSLFTVLRLCQWVEPSAGTEGEAEHVLFYRNRNGFGNVKPVETK